MGFLILGSFRRMFISAVGTRRPLVGESVENVEGLQECCWFCINPKTNVWAAEVRGPDTQPLTHPAMTKNYSSVFAPFYFFLKSKLPPNPHQKRAASRRSNPPWSRPSSPPPNTDGRSAEAGSNIETSEKSPQTFILTDRVFVFPIVAGRWLRVWLVRLL